MINVDNINFTELYNGAAKIVQMYKQELELQKVNASGELSRSADFDVDFDENDITVYFIANAQFYYVEYGRRPTGSGGGQTWVDPITDISNWMQNKMSRGWFIPRNSRPIPKTPKEIRRVASAIVRKIHRQGFYDPNSQGKHILRTVLERAEQQGIIQKMVNSVVSAFDEEINVAIEEI